MAFLLRANVMCQRGKWAVYSACTTRRHVFSVCAAPCPGRCAVWPRTVTSTPCARWGRTAWACLPLQHTRTYSSEPSHSGGGQREARRSRVVASVLVGRGQHTAAVPVAVEASGKLVMHTEGVDNCGAKSRARTPTTAWSWGWSWAQRGVRTLLPAGYPSSVTADYLPAMLWHGTGFVLSSAIGGRIHQRARARAALNTVVWRCVQCCRCSRCCLRWAWAPAPPSPQPLHSTGSSRTGSVGQHHCMITVAVILSLCWCRSAGRRAVCWVDR